MTIHKISTPEADHTGLLGRIMIHNGTARVDSDQHPEELAYMAQAGYTIDPPYPHVEPDEEPDEEMDVDGDGTVEKLPRRNASLETWREFAIAHGVTPDEANAASRDDLIARLTKEDSK